MELKKFVDSLRNISLQDTGRLGDFTNYIKTSLWSFENDYNALGNALYKVCEEVMKMKYVKPQCVQYYQEIISQVIKISIKHQFRVGYDALRFVFNIASQFYKTSNLDISLNYPIGKERPLKQYVPEIGQQCDVVKPYITSTGYCGWTRCIVLQKQNNKYTIKHANSCNPENVNQNIWFAPLNTRLTDYQWRTELNVGSLVDACLEKVWYKSTVVEIKQQNDIKKVRISFRRFAQDGDRTDSEGNKYFGLGPNEDDWMQIVSPRIQKPNKMSDKKLCYYTFNSEEILLDDNYDILFQRQFEQKPFYGIMRIISCKSLSLLKFINQFVSNKGIEKVLELMDRQEVNDQPVYLMLTNIAVMVQFFPRMFIRAPIFRQLYGKIFYFFQKTAKSLNPFKIDCGYFCYDSIGRRLFSLTEVYRDQNELRKCFINEFLKMNMQKQMFALRYLYDLINPKKVYSLQQRKEVNIFLVKEKIFERIFNSSTHQQIISRASNFLDYLIKNQIIGVADLETVWKIATPTDLRTKKIVFKLFSDLVKNVNLQYVEFILGKILSLKESEITPQSLNILRQIKGRSIDKNSQMKILTYLWDLLTVKSGSVKVQIEEEIQRVFKSFVSSLKDPFIRMKLLSSMTEKISESKRIKSEITVLKDFISSYPELTSSEYKDSTQYINVPLNLHQAVSFLKSENIYRNLLKIIQNTKDQSVKKEVLNFIRFLFENDHEEVSQIIHAIYCQMGASTNFLYWLYQVIDRAIAFVLDLFEDQQNFIKFEDLTQNGFQSVKDLIIGVNRAKNNIRIINRFTYRKQGSKQKNNQSLVKESHSTFFVLVSPFQIVGMKLLQNLLHIVKENRIYGPIIKLLIEMIINVDESIEEKTQQFRKEFLEEIINQIVKIEKQNIWDSKIKSKLQVYLNIFIQFFSETEKNGLGTLETHLENVQGDLLTFEVQNLFPQSKNDLPKFFSVADENYTLWRLKQKIGELINIKPEYIDIIKHKDRVEDSHQGKSLTALAFYNQQQIKISPRSSRSVGKEKLLNQKGDDVSQKLEKIIRILFDEYKDKQLNALTMKDMQKLSGQRWKSSLFRQKKKLNQIFQMNDKQKKGHLFFSQFKQFFFYHSKKNQNAIWRIINLSGFQDNLQIETDLSPQRQSAMSEQILPRRILSSSKVYDIIYSILCNPKFKEVHNEFYFFLTMLEVDKRKLVQIKEKIYKTLMQQNSIYLLSYSIDIINSLLKKEDEQFFHQFWARNGIETIQDKIEHLISVQNIEEEQSKMVNNILLPGLIKILNIYLRQIYSTNKVIIFLALHKINNLQPEEFLNKIRLTLTNQQLQQVCISNDQKPKIIISSQKIERMNKLGLNILHSLIKNLHVKKSQYLRRLTIEGVRLLATLVANVSQSSSLDPTQILYGINSTSLNYRRSIIIIIYIYFFYSKKSNMQYIEQVINKLIDLMPKEVDSCSDEYFIVLNYLTDVYLAQNMNKTQKDAYFIEIGNKMLNNIFNLFEPESRTALSSNKMILGSLKSFQIILKKDNFSQFYANRIEEITTKCLFCYNIEDRFKQINISEQMLQNCVQAQHFSHYVICKTQNTRDVVYRIISRLCSLQPQYNNNYLLNYLLPVIKSIKDDVRFTPPKSLAVGLKNFGSTCYMNSMLQVLNTVLPFRNELMKCNSDHPLIKQLKQFFAALFYSERIDYAPLGILNAFQPPINPLIQQDTTQFLNYLFDNLEKGFSETKYKKLLDQIFKGAYTGQMICQSCGYKKQSREQFFSFGVQIEGKKDLHAALQGSYQGQVISDYLCDGCHNKVSITKRNVLSQIPNVMFIHLRRIVFNYDLFVNMKIHTRLQFPQQLNIQPFTKQGIQLRQKFGIEYIRNLSSNSLLMKEFQSLSLHGKQKDYYKLVLKGVIVHSGSADVGHYYSILRPNKIWRKYDDSRVSLFTASDFDSKCYGGSMISDDWGSGTSANAYVLVYEKVIKNPIKIHISQDVIETINYEEVRVFNSPSDYIKMWLDNHNFMLQTQILDPKIGKNFLIFVCKLLSSSSLPNIFQIVSEIYYRISYHSGFVADIQSIIIKNAEKAIPHIFEAYVSKNQRTLKLLLHQQKAVRDSFATYLQIVLIESFKKGDQKVRADVLTFIGDLLSSLHGEVAKNWHRIDSYLKLIFLLVSNSIAFIDLYRYLLSRNLISVLIDFILQKSSPLPLSPKTYSIGSQTYPVDFTYGLAIINFLLKHSYGFTGKNYQKAHIPHQFLFHLSDNDVLLLSHIQFYRKMIKEKQNFHELSLIIQRLCIQNLPFSKSIITAILQSIGIMIESKDELVIQSRICLQILKIRDIFWEQRAQMLIGIGLPKVINNNLIECLDEYRFTYSSSIFDISPAQPLLASLCQYNKINPLGCFHLSKSILQACDLQEEVKFYILSQPPPNYLYSSYLQFLEYFISTCPTNCNVDSKNKQKFQKEVCQLLKKISNIRSSQNIILKDCLITGEITNKKLIKNISLKDIEVNINQYEVYCLPYETDQKGKNKTMESQLQFYRLTKSVTPTSNILRLMKSQQKMFALKLVAVQEDQPIQLFDFLEDSPATIIESKPEDTQKVQKTEKAEKKEEKNSQIEQIEVNIEGVFICNCLRQIEIVNLSKEKKKIVCMEFSTLNKSNFNIIHQKTWVVLQKGNEKLWVQKNNIEKDWNQLEFKLTVHDYSNENLQRIKMQRQFFKLYENKIDLEPIVTEKEEVRQTQNQQVKNLIVKKQDARKQIEVQQPTQINCPTCTFFNPSTAPTCDMCGASLK